MLYIKKITLSFAERNVRSMLQRKNGRRTENAEIACVAALIKQFIRKAKNCVINITNPSG